MAKTLVDVDEAALRRAGEILGTATMNDTINTALNEVVANHERTEAIEREIARARSGYYADVDNDSAWR
jgi:hypothetical protein